jgi:hypothetical protein
VTELLTFHADRLDRLPPEPGMDGDDIAGHFLLTNACNEGVITWDRTVWGDLLFRVTPHRNDPRALHPDLLDIEYTVSRFGPSIGASIEPPTIDAMTSEELDIWIEEYNNMTTEEQLTRPSEFPDPTHQRANYLSFLVTAFNKLHHATEQMVMNWPARTGHPLI